MLFQEPKKEETSKDTELRIQKTHFLAITYVRELNYYCGVGLRELSRLSGGGLSILGKWFSEDNWGEKRGQTEVKKNRKKR